jgi:hypothetical protein
MGQCGTLANLLYHRLTAQAVDQGRLPGDPLDVKTRCVPYLEQATLAEIAEALDSLEAQGWIVRYSVDDETYLQITKWWNEQHGARRAYPCEYPGPEGWEDHDFGYPGGPNKPDFARIFKARGKTPHNAARGRQALQGAVAYVPIPVPDPNPVANADAVNSPPSWSDGPLPSFEEMLRKPSDREDGPPIDRVRKEVK